MKSQAELQDILKANIDATMQQVNAALKGNNLDAIEETLARLGRGRQVPHWFEMLKSNHTLPNLDGKTIGSVVEMLLVAVLENYTFKDLDVAELKVNPARGVDIPALGLGVKSPSTNFCTSEPYFTAYERLLGNEYDALVLLTDYQEAKANPPLRLQITSWRYLENTEIADGTLCGVALKHRDWLLKENEAWLKKLYRFLAFINQSDWRARHLLKMVDSLGDDAAILGLIEKAEQDFQYQNTQRTKKMTELIPDSDLEALQSIREIQPLVLGVLDAADNWVTEVQKDAGRYPNENEWNRLLTSPLNGKIGMSFALQWRYNFGRLFGAKDETSELLEK